MAFTRLGHHHDIVSLALIDASDANMGIPETMKAVKTTTPGNAEVQDVPVPKVKDDFILVKVKYVALNPTDWYACRITELSTELDTL